MTEVDVTEVDATEDVAIEVTEAGTEIGAPVSSTALRQSIPRSESPSPSRGQSELLRYRTSSLSEQNPKPMSPCTRGSDRDAKPPNQAWPLDTVGYPGADLPFGATNVLLWSRSPWQKVPMRHPALCLRK